MKKQNHDKGHKRQKEKVRYVREGGVSVSVAYPVGHGEER